MAAPAARDADPILRVVHISDLHLQRVTHHARRIAETVNELEADTVVFTGDMIDKKDRVSELREFLALLTPSSRKYATLGNWEHWAKVDISELRRVYADVGCQLMVNQTVSFDHAGQTVLITGFDDATAGRPDIDAALAGVAPASNHLVLAHSPVFRDTLGGRDLAYRINCVLSGHTHGGQVALFGWAPVRPRGSGRYNRGWYRDMNPPLYVSRGLGTTILPVRFGSSPEVALFEWRLIES